MPPIKSPGKPKVSSEELHRLAVEAGAEMILRVERYGNRLDWLYEGIAYGVTDSVRTGLSGRWTTEQMEAEQLRRMNSHRGQESVASNRWGAVDNQYGITVEMSDTSGRIKIFGVGESDFLKWLGYQCWSEEEVATFYDNLSIRHPKPTTLKVCLSQGCNQTEEDYLEKPFDPEKVLAIEKCGGRIVEVDSNE